MLNVRAISQEVDKLEPRLGVLHHLAKIKYHEFEHDALLQKQAVRHIEGMIDHAKVIALYILSDRKEILRDGYMFQDIAKCGIGPPEFAEKADHLVSEWGKEQALEPKLLYKAISKFLTTFERLVEYIKSHVDLVG